MCQNHTQLQLKSHARLLLHSISAQWTRSYEIMNHPRQAVFHQRAKSSLLLCFLVVFARCSAMQPNRLGTFWNNSQTLSHHSHGSVALWKTLKRRNKSLFQLTWWLWQWPNFVCFMSGRYSFQPCRWNSKLSFFYNELLNLLSLARPSRGSVLAIARVALLKTRSFSGLT